MEQSFNYLEKQQDDRHRKSINERETTKFPVRVDSSSGEQDILRRLAAVELLYHFSVCPLRWFFPQASGRPRVGFWLAGCLPMPEPFTPLAMGLEHAVETSFALSIVFLLLAPCSLSTGSWLRYAGFLMTLSYLGLVMFDVTRACGIVIHSVALLLIASSANDGLVAARIATAGTWLWAGFHKINPSFLNNYTMADPILDMVLGSEFASKHRIGLHLMAALMEALVGLVLLMCSAGPKLTTGAKVNWIMRAIVMVCTVFISSMHLMIVAQLYQKKWDISVIGKNIQCAILALWLWRSWWKGWPTAKASRFSSRSGKIAAMGATLVFVVVPAGLTFGVVDPYLGISMYSDNVPLLWVEFPTQLSEIYQQWGFLEWPPPLGWNIPPVAALTHDGREVYRRSYIMMNAASTGGHEGYPAIWYYKQYASKMCQEIRTAAKMHDKAKAIDDARFLIEPHYTGRDLFNSLVVMLLPDKEAVPKILFVREGCRKESENEWRPLNRNGVHYHTDVSFRVKPGSKSVDIYQIGVTDGKERPELHYSGRVYDYDPLIIRTWAGTQLLVAVGGHRSNYGSYDQTNNLCALDVLLMTESTDHKQFFEIDPSKGNTSGRSISRLQECSLDQVQSITEDNDEDYDGRSEERVVTFVNAVTHNTSIDVLWVPPNDEENPVAVLSNLLSGKSGRLESFVGHRFRGAPVGKVKSCFGEAEYVVPGERGNIRHVFCSESDDREHEGKRDEL